MRKLVLISCLMLGSAVNAQISNPPPPGGGGPPGGPGAPVPLSGIEFLMAAGALLGGSKLLLDRLRQKQ